MQGRAFTYLRNLCVLWLFSVASVAGAAPVDPCETALVGSAAAQAYLRLFAYGLDQQILKTEHIQSTVNAKNPVSPLSTTARTSTQNSLARGFNGLLPKLTAADWKEVQRGLERLEGTHRTQGSQRKQAKEKTKGLWRAREIAELTFDNGSILFGKMFQTPEGRILVTAVAFPANHGRMLIFAPLESNEPIFIGAEQDMQFGRMIGWHMKPDGELLAASYSNEKKHLIVHSPLRQRDPLLVKNIDTGSASNVEAPRWHVTSDGRLLVATLCFFDLRVFDISQPHSPGWFAKTKTVIEDAQWFKNSKGESYLYVQANRTSYVYQPTRSTEPVWTSALPEGRDMMSIAMTENAEGQTLLAAASSTAYGVYNVSNGFKTVTEVSTPVNRSIKLEWIATIDKRTLLSVATNSKLNLIEVKDGKTKTIWNVEENEGYTSYPSWFASIDGRLHAQVTGLFTKYLIFRPLETPEPVLRIADAENSPQKPMTFLYDEISESVLLGARFAGKPQTFRFLSIQDSAEIVSRVQLKGTHGSPLQRLDLGNGRNWIAVDDGNTRIVILEAGVKR